MAAPTGMDGYDCFRYFHFYKKEVHGFDNGREIRKQVGVLDCKATLQAKVWHDSRGRAGNIIPLFKDPLFNLDYDSFWNVPDKVPNYVVQAQSEDTLSKLQMGIDAASAKIRRTRTEEVLLEFTFS
jgi:hypothetical protein